MRSKPKRELPFQTVIINSYKACGGYAAKWKDEYSMGKPDLVGSLLGIGVHLLEVKHLPDVDPVHTKSVKNPLTPKQREITENFHKAGGLVFVAVVCRSSHARGSELGLFNPLLDEFEVSYVKAHWEPYTLGKGYDMISLLARRPR